MALESVWLFAFELVLPEFDDIDDRLEDVWGSPLALFMAA